MMYGLWHKSRQWIMIISETKELAHGSNTINHWKKNQKINT